MNTTRNLRALPAYAFLGDFVAIAPVLVPWYLAHGLGATAVFTVQAVFAGAMALMEVPSGFVADALGRRSALVLGALFWPAGLLMYRFGGGLPAFLGAELVLSIAVSLQSGCLSALLFDSLAALQRDGEYQRREGHMGAAARWGSLAASLMGGLLATWSLAWPFNLCIATYAMLLPMALLLEEPPREKPPWRKAWSEILAVSWACLRPGPLLPWILGAGLMTAVGMVSLWASFLAYRAWHLSLFWNGVLFALFQLGGVLGGHCSAPWRARLGTRAFVLLLLLPGPLLLLLAACPDPSVIPAFILLAFLWNLGQPFFFEGINRRTESRVRATVLSVANLVARILFVLLGPAFGAVVERASLARAFGILGLLACAGLGAAAWAILRVEAEPA